MPLVARRLFSTSLRSKNTIKGAKAPRTAFSDRFGSSNEQPPDPQSSFPAWPGAQPPQQASSHPATYAARRPPPNLLTSLEEKGKGSTEKKPGGQTSEGPGVLFSSIIGNASAFVNTSSFDAKPAIEPTAETHKQLMLAVKSNMHRFSSLPPSAKQSFNEQEYPTDFKDVLLNTNNSSAADVDESMRNPSSKMASHNRRTSIIPTPGRRMLSTCSLETYSPQVPTTVEPPLGTGRWSSSVTNTSNRTFWQECLAWMLAPTTNQLPHSLYSASNFFYKLHSSPQHFMYSNRALSFLHPVPCFSPALVRGYATHRPKISKPQTPPQHPTVPNFSDPPPNPNAPCVLIPAPTTPAELCNVMRHLIQSTIPPLPISRLIATHSQYSALYTATSFNILLAHTVRVAPVPYFSQLITQMRTSGIAWDPKTETLAVRAHIQAGRWFEATELAERTWMPDSGGASNVPLDVFTELMHLALTKKASQEDVSTMAQRSWKLFPTHVSAVGSPRLTYNVVRLLIKQGRVDEAIQLARRLFESLGSPREGAPRYCRAIMALIIRPPKYQHKRSQSDPPRPFHERLTLFESLLTHNPSLGLIPDAMLTLRLLENLSRLRNRGPIALHKLTEFRSKYGPGVEDSAVRRLVARYAMEERKLGLTRVMLEREEQARAEPVDASASSHKSDSHKVPWAGNEHIPMQSHLEYLRNIGTENAKWSILARNLRNLEEKQKLGSKKGAWALDTERTRPGRGWHIRLGAIWTRGKKSEKV